VEFFINSIRFAILSERCKFDPHYLFHLIAERTTDALTSGEFCVVVIQDIRTRDDADSLFDVNIGAVACSVISHSQKIIQMARK
jgi:hypothetical protein